MTKQEYLEWKEQNPEEWEQVYNEVVSDFTEYRNNTKGNDDCVYFRAVSADPNQQVFTLGRVSKALENKNDCCDLLVQMHKQYIEYKKKLNEPC